MITAAGASMLFGIFGASFNEQDALITAIAVTPTDAGAILPLEGVTFDLDVVYTLALAPQATGAYAPGNTTTSAGIVAFGGIAPGTVDLSVSPPDGMTCVNWIAKDAGTRMTTYELAAGVNTLIWYCEPG